MKKQTQKQTKYNITTGKKYTTPENYTGINTPYFSAGDYTKRERPTPANLGPLTSKIFAVKERHIMEFLGKKVILFIDRIEKKNTPHVEIKPNGQEETTYTEDYFYIMKFPGGQKEYFFKINNIMLDTLHANGLINGPVQKSEAVSQYETTLAELVNCTGHNLAGYFYYTMDNGGGKKLFATAESVERYHNAIQAKFENAQESISDQTPQDQEKAN